MESLGGAGGERCKALAKQRKVQVVEQAKSLRLTVKPHLTAAIQGHLPFLRKSLHHNVIITTLAKRGSLSIEHSQPLRCLLLVLLIILI